MEAVCGRSPQIEASPAARIPEPGVEQSRDRVLTDDELRELWLKLDEIVRAGETQNQPEAEAKPTDDGRSRRRKIPVATAEAFQVQLLTATRVYDRYAYDIEKRAALERWSSRLTAILEKKPAKVIPIAR